MGKRLRQQKAGKGSMAYRRPSHRFKSDAKYRKYDETERNGILHGEITGFVDDPAHSAILMEVMFENNESKTLIAPEGAMVGEQVCAGIGAELKIGNILPLRDLPDGTPIYNIELVAGDGGRIVRSAGAVAYIISHEPKGVLVRLPSKKVAMIDQMCRAQVGVISGGGRLEKPLLKAGNSHYKFHALNRRWPHNRGVKMSAYNHPFGGKQHHKGKSSCVSHGAPPGRKVGHIGARSTGRKKTRITAETLKAGSRT